MTFEITKEHEISHPLIDSDITGIYPVIRMHLNENIFLVDIENDDVIERYMLTSIDNTIKLIEDNSESLSSISILLRKCDNTNNKYSIFDVETIVKAKDKSDQNVWVFHSDTGETHFTSHLAKSINELTVLNTMLYHRKT